MGNNRSFALCKTCLVTFCVVNKKRNKHKVVKVVNSDGKVTTFTSPILVKDALGRLYGGSFNSGIGLSKEANSESLQLDYELQVGKVYYLLPCVKRVKVVITKQQLKELLANQISFEDLLFGFDKNKVSSTNDRRFFANRKLSLESIPEEIE